MAQRIRDAARARRGAAVVLLSGIMLVLSGLVGLSANASSGGAFTTDLAAEAGQTPMPDGVTAVPEDCKGIAPTNGSPRATTQKQLNEGQGIIKPKANSFQPGGTVHWLVKYDATKKKHSKSFDIRDCVVEFLPGNSHLAGVLAMVDTSPTGYGQIFVTGPGATPDSKGYDNVLDNAEFDFADNQAMPGEFDLSWTVPPDAPPGALICNYVKDTGGSTKGGKENRKAGACFELPQTTTTTAPTTTSTTAPTTTSTTVPSTTTSTTAPTTTSTTLPSTTTTTAPTTTTSTTTPVETTTTTAPCESTTTTADEETTTTVNQCETTTTAPPETTTTTAPVETTTTTVPCESTTTTAGEQTTTTANQCETTTVPPETTTTVATGATVLGEQFVKPSPQVANQSLARTGTNIYSGLLWAGVALFLGGFIGLFSDQKRGLSAGK